MLLVHEQYMTQYSSLVKFRLVLTFDLVFLRYYQTLRYGLLIASLLLTITASHRYFASKVLSLIVNRQERVIRL